MKLFSRKNKKINQSGFAALFAVLVSSILLVMALSISGVAYKEQLFSINSKASQYSFMAADSGMECALLWDVNNAYDWFNPNSNNDPAGISCGEVNSLGYMFSNQDLHVYELSVNATVNSNVISSCAIFSINKDYDDDGDGVGDSTKIDSRGYNVDCSDISFGNNPNGIGDIEFSNGVGRRAVERYLGAIYANN